MLPFSSNYRIQKITDKASISICAHTHQCDQTYMNPTSDLTALDLSPPKGLNELKNTIDHSCGSMCMPRGAK